MSIRIFIVYICIIYLYYIVVYICDYIVVLYSHSNTTDQNKRIIKEGLKMVIIMENKILEVIKAMNDSEIVSLWNEYVYATNRYDDEIIDQYSLEEYVNNSSDTMNILNRFYFGQDGEDKESSANPNRNYFTFNGYGNIISFDYIYNNFTEEFYYIDIDDLIDYIIENKEAFYNDDIQEILDQNEKIEA